MRFLLFSTHDSHYSSMCESECASDAKKLVKLSKG